jgi:hypothetical protein
LSKDRYNLANINITAAGLLVYVITCPELYAGIQSLYINPEKKPSPLCPFFGIATPDTWSFTQVTNYFKN